LQFKPPPPENNVFVIWKNNNEWKENEKKKKNKILWAVGDRLPGTMLKSPLLRSANAAYEQCQPIAGSE